ncbi:ATP synthase subunit I [Pectinatus haikarae]|uniref:L-asparagine transporter-like permease n=1 Tax=Pectinatus haikarae TaxID=349096 RepID=A0ABT9Y5E7_9FIRM|nr:ATP synthase subunit I [Pectinatus haikarae]MDQ0203057.1 L-asparagine transporter-like permease [Pectinatus haikarae]
MHDFAAVRGRSIIISILAITLLIFINLFLNSDVYLFTAIICGYLAAVYYAFMLAVRIRKIMLLSQPAAKRSARSGILFRIVFLLLILLIVIKFSKVFFIAFITGFFIMHLVIFINLIIFSYQKKIH